MDNMNQYNILKQLLIKENLYIDFKKRMRKCLNERYSHEEVCIPIAYTIFEEIINNPKNFIDTSFTRLNYALSKNDIIKTIVVETKLSTSDKLSTQNWVQETLDTMDRIVSYFKNYNINI